MINIGYAGAQDLSNLYNNVSSGVVIIETEEKGKI
jgi:hypothetical protein